MPSALANPYLHDGAVSVDGLIKDMLNVVEQQLTVNTTPVSLTNPTSATDMMTFTIAAPTSQSQSLNAAGKALQITAYGTYNLGAASTVVITVKLGGQTLGTFTSGSNATTGVTLGWQLYLNSITVGTGAAGTAEAHGSLCIDIGATIGAAVTEYFDSNTAVITSINYTQPLLLEVMANFGTGNGASVIAERVLQVEVYN